MSATAPDAPRVSVLLPVFDGAGTLERAIESILAQSFQDFELILHDDGSNDGSFELIERMLARDPRIRASRSPRNEGLGRAMARLAAQARGEYLAIQEQDDESLPARLAAEVEVLDREPEVGLVSGVAEWLDDRGEPLRLFPGILARGGQYPQDRREMVEYLYVEQCKVVNAGCLFRRAALEGLPLAGPPVRFDPEARMSVDWQLFLRLAHHWRIWGLPDVVVRMARGERHASLSRRKEIQFAEARRCLGLLYRELADDPASPIDARLHRRAMATQLLLEGRFWGGRRALARFLHALVLEPGRLETWQALGGLARRASARIVRRDGES